MKAIKQKTELLDEESPNSGLSKVIVLKPLLVWALSPVFWLIKTNKP